VFTNLWRATSDENPQISQIAQIFIFYLRNLWIIFRGGMMEKIEAARRGEGLIELESDSAEQVKQAIQKVSAITAIEGGRVSFEGQRIVEGHGFGLDVNCYDIYKCPNGYLLHTYMNNGPNWAAAGKTLQEMLNASPDLAVAKRAHGELVKKNLISMKH
jgi:hypothetical protein